MRVAIAPIAEGINSRNATVRISLRSRDVYKRQSYVIPKVICTVVSACVAAYGFGRFDFPGRKLMFNIMPVSYTHLDVYKRQGRPSGSRTGYRCG